MIFIYAVCHWRVYVVMISEWLRMLYWSIMGRRYCTRAIATNRLNSIINTFFLCNKHFVCITVWIEQNLVIVSVLKAHFECSFLWTQQITHHSIHADVFVNKSNTIFYVPFNFSQFFSLFTSFVVMVFGMVGNISSSSILFAIPN